MKAYVKTWERITNLLLGFIFLGGSMIIWLQGKIDYGKDATLIWVAGMLFIISLYPLLDAFTFPSKVKTDEEYAKEIITKNAQ